MKQKISENSIGHCRAPHRSRLDSVAMSATVKSSAKLFGGMLQRLTHASKTCACDMTFAVFMPPQARALAAAWLGEAELGQRRQPEGSADSEQSKQRQHRAP